LYLYAIRGDQSFDSLVKAASTCFLLFSSALSQVASSQQLVKSISGRGGADLTALHGKIS
jgi:hypothetical protein